MRHYMMGGDFRVGAWLVRPALGVVTRDQHTVRIRAKVMDLLVFFAEHAGEVLTKDQLLDGVWGTASLSESSLTRTMTELRQALDDDAEQPVLIETIPKRGYRLIATVTAVSLPAPAPTPAPAPAPAFTVARHSRRYGAAALSLMLVVLTAGFSSGRRPSDDATRLVLHDRPLVLITRFANLTQQPVFDGAVEYALERELSGSTRVGLVPIDRVYDTLGLMKKPAETVVDLAVGREICLRDGGINVLVSGRIEKVGSRYLVTTQLIKPADGAILTSIAEEAASLEAILPALRRAALRIRDAIGEQGPSLDGPLHTTEHASTTSLRAFQLYSESYQLGRQGKWNGAVELGRQAVEADPAFASGWTWLAWALHSAPAQMSDVLSASRRALALTHTVADWERHWIVGSHHLLSRDYDAAARSFEALIALRPDSYYGVEHLGTAYTGLGRPDAALEARKRLTDLRPNDLALNHRAAFEIVRLTGRMTEAAPYVDRMRALLPAVPAKAAAFPAAWLEAWPAYEAWARGDIKLAREQVDRFAQRIPPSSEAARDFHNVLANFYLSLGRLRDAEALFEKAEDYGQLAIAAELRGDLPNMRKWLLRTPNPSAMRVDRFIRAGLLTEARHHLRSDTSIVGNPLTIQQVVMAAPLGRGYLALAEGRAHAALPEFRASLAISKTMFDASYYSGCLGLAAAFEQLGNLAEVIETLTACASRVPPYGGIFAGGNWIQVQHRLAGYYRSVDRSDEADSLERNIRHMLQFADQDHPALTRWVPQRAISTTSAPALR